MLEPIASVQEFYAHALAIEREAAKCYREFQEHFTGRGEEVLAGLCGKLAHPNAFQTLDHSQQGVVVNVTVVHRPLSQEN